MEKDKGFSCKDCDQFYDSSIGSIKLVNKANKNDFKIVCAKCSEKYNIRKPN